MALKNQEQLHKVLVTVFEQISPVLNQIEYRLVGTAASLLHGVHLTTNDIDLLAKERRSVDEFGTAMQAHFGCLISPTYLSDDQQYLASYEVDGIEVEMSTVEWETDSDGLECIGPGPWKHFQLLSCGQYQLPTIALEIRLGTELARGRADRYDPLIGYLQQQGCDIGLVRQSIKSNGLSAQVQADIVRRLERK